MRTFSDLIGKDFGRQTDIIRLRAEKWWLRIPLSECWKDEFARKS
jgi:hypothetical protein